MIPKISASHYKVSQMATRKMMLGCVKPEIYVKDRWAPLAYTVPKFVKEFMNGLKYLKR